VQIEARSSASASHAMFYDRNHPRYPYRSHGQWLKASYGVTACLIMLLFNGIPPFLKRPFDTSNFFVSYISVSLCFGPKFSCAKCSQIPIFITLVLSYKIGRHGLHISRWGPERSCDLSGAIQASENRVGRLKFLDKGITMGNVVAFVKWIWVWMK